MWAKLLSVFLGAPAEQIADYFKEKQRLKHELKKAKLEGEIEVERAKSAAAAARQAHLAEWELASLANSGWKDEFVIILISIPLPAAFVPVLQEYILRGFEILGMTPYWYMGLVLAVFLAVYGIRWKGAETLKVRGLP